MVVSVTESCLTINQASKQARKQTNSHVEEAEAATRAGLMIPFQTASK